MRRIHWRYLGRDILSAGRGCLFLLTTVGSVPRALSPARARPKRSGDRVLDCAERLDLDAHDVAAGEERRRVLGHADP